MRCTQVVDLSIVVTVTQHLHLSVTSSTGLLTHLDWEELRPELGLELELGLEDAVTSRCFANWSRNGIFEFFEV